MNPVIPVGQAVPPECDGPDERSQGYLEHAEVEFCEPHAKPPDHQPRQRRGEGCGNKGKPHGKTGLGDHERKGVGPHPVKHAVMKLEQAPVPYHHVEAHGQESRHKNQGEDVGIKTRNHGRQEKQDDSERREKQNGYSTRTIFPQDQRPPTKPISASLWVAISTR